MDSVFNKIIFNCPHCGSVQYADKYGAAAVRCRQCGKALKVPGGRELAVTSPDREDTVRWPVKTVAVSVLCAAAGAALAVCAAETGSVLPAAVALFFFCGIFFMLRAAAGSYTRRLEEIERATKRSKTRLADPEYAQLLRQLGEQIDDRYLSAFDYGTKHSRYDDRLRQASSGSDAGILKKNELAAKKYKLYSALCLLAALTALALLTAAGNIYELLSGIMSAGLCAAAAFVLKGLSRERTAFIKAAGTVLECISREELSLDALENKTGLSFEKLIILLQDMFDEGMLEGTYVDVDRGLLAVPYVTVYYVKCPNCGGTGPKTFRSTGHCQYCGGELK